MKPRKPPKGYEWVLVYQMVNGKETSKYVLEKISPPKTGVVVQISKNSPGSVQTVGVVIRPCGNAER